MASNLVTNLQQNPSSFESVTKVGAYEPFDLQVARGQIAGHTTVSIFGYQANVTTSPIPIWENATTYTFPASAATANVASGSASDIGATVLINGLDANFNPLSETVTIASGNTVTTNSYLRVNNLFLTKPGSGYNTNQGAISVKQGSNTLAQINTNIGKSQSTIYTVPNGYTFYLDYVEANTSNIYTSGNYLIYNVVTNNNVTGVQSSVLQQPFTSIYTATRSQDPFAYGQKTDIQWQLKTSTGTYAVGIIVTGKLIKNDGQTA
jgi:hypothetical protein